MDDLDSVNDRAAAYLTDNGRRPVGGWTIADRGTVAGRGVLATRDYGPGDVILVDVPLIVSPRALAAADGPACAVCYTAVSAAAAVACPGGCRMPLCGRPCAGRAEHADDECGYVRRLRPKPGGGTTAWSTGVYNAIAAVRGVVAFKRGRYGCFLHALQKRSSDQPAYEVADLKRNVAAELPEDDERVMTATCRIMDANCFETTAVRGGRPVSLKGLYPVASFMNHSCVPNTMHNFNGQLEMTVKASLPVYSGQELTTSYTRTVWPTPLRQKHLLASKQFVCTCDRCRDPEEFGTQLAALGCKIANCDGRALPINPLDPSTVWQCKACGRLTSSVEMTWARERVAASRPKNVDATVDGYAVDTRLRSVWTSRNDALDLDRLLFKEDTCEQLLRLVRGLGLGRCRLLGLLSAELSRVITEKIDRFRWDSKTLNIFREQIVELKKIASSILDEE